MATGKDLNHIFLEKMDKKREDYLSRGKTESELSGNVVDVSGNNTEFVSNDDLESFKAINELKNYLEFSTFNPDETYEIPGVKVYQRNREQRVPLYIRKADIGKIADKAEEFEDLLDIKLPAQIYQFQDRYYGDKVPGTNIDIPRPKLMSETGDQYEEYLRSVYEQEDIEPEPSPDGIGRLPYIHEQVDYSIENVLDESFFSEYYLDMQREERLGEMFPNSRTGRPNNRIDEDDEYTVRESDDLERTPLGQKIGATLTTFENTFKNASTWQKLRHAAIGTLVVGAGCFFAYTNPLAVGTLVVAGGLGTIGGFALKKLVGFVKKKANNWLYGREIEDVPEEEHPPIENTPPTPTGEPPQPSRRPNPQGSGSGSGSGAPTPTPGPAPQPQPQTPQTPIPQELDAYFSEAGLNIEQYREIERRIQVAENELSILIPGSPSYQSKQQEIAELKKQQKEELGVIEVLLEDLLSNLKYNNNGQGRQL